MTLQTFQTCLTELMSKSGLPRQNRDHGFMILSLMIELTPDQGLYRTKFYKSLIRLRTAMFSSFFIGVGKALVSAFPLGSSFIFQF
jgi:hypothetical protein